MRVLFAGVAALLLLAAPMEDALAQDAPTVTAVTFESFPKSGDTYKRGEEIRVGVTFSEAIVVTGTPRYRLGMKGSGRRPWADYNAALSNGSRLIFVYTIQAEDRTPVGVTPGGRPVLNNGTIKSADDMTDANLEVKYYNVNTNWQGFRTAFKVDGSQVDSGTSTAPTALSRTFVSTPAAEDTYKLGEQIRIAMDFDGAVVVTGKPRIPFSFPPSNLTRWATYDAARSTGTRLVFSYTVQEADRGNEIVDARTNFPTAFELNSGTIRSAADARDANIRRAHLAEKSNYKVDGFAGVATPTVPSVSSVEILRDPENGDTFGLQEFIYVGVKFSPDVVMPRGQSVRPQLALTIGSQTRQADFHSTTPDGALRFVYRVQSVDRDTDGISIAANALTLGSGGTIAHLHSPNTGANLDLGSHAVSNDGRYKVSGTRASPPRVYIIRLGTGTDFSDPRCSPVFRLDCTHKIIVLFDKIVDVTGEPQLALTVGGQTRHADYVAHWGGGSSNNGAGGSTIRFSYAVQASDRDPDGISVAGASALTLNGGTITIRGGKTAANLDLSRAFNNFSVDHPLSRHPVDGGGGTNLGGGGGNPEPRLRVSSVRFTGTPVSGNTYRLGEQIQAAVTFNEAITVTGTPQINLTIGSQTRWAVYDATRSKGTLLVFSYTVQATDADSDGISIAANALALNGGMISLTSGSTTTAAALAHTGVGTDDTRKVDGSTDVVEHGNSREQATLLVLSARTTGEVGETGNDDDFRVNVAVEQSAEVAGALEQAGDGDYFRVEVTEAVLGNQIIFCLCYKLELVVLYRWSQLTLCSKSNGPPV